MQYEIEVRNKKDEVAYIKLPFLPQKEQVISMTFSDSLFPIDYVVDKSVVNIDKYDGTPSYLLYVSIY